MRFAFTEDQLALRDGVRDVLSKVCTPAHVRAAWTASPASLPTAWAELAEQGVLGARVPEAAGGLGLRDVDTVLLFEEAGRCALPAPLADVVAVAAPLLAELGGTLADEWLARTIAGDALVVTQLAGAPFVPFADAAGLVLVERGDALHAVRRERASVTPEATVDGARRLHRVDFDASEATCVASGRAARAAMDAAFDRGALATAAELCGLARATLDLTVEYAKVRKQFGKPIGSFQAVKHHLANALGAVEMARPAVAYAAWSASEGEPDAPLWISLAKVRASDAATFVAKVALQCHGAIGYSTEHDLHLFMKRAWALAAAWGDASFHRERIAKRVLTAGAPPVGDL